MFRQKTHHPNFPIGAPISFFILFSYWAKFKSSSSFLTSVFDWLLDEIIDICVENGWGYNLLTEKFDKDNTVVINPTSVDIEVLNGCLRLALVCNTSDQFLFSSYEGFDTVYDTDDHKPVEKDIDEITTNILNVRPVNNKSTN